MLSSKISNLTVDSLEIKSKALKIQNSTVLREKMDALVYEAVFGEKKDKVSARWIIWEAAPLLKVMPSSIHKLYRARGKEEVNLYFTVPAFNIRGLTYDVCRQIFKVAKQKDVGTFILELARSEMGYTNQTPEEYVTVILAAAIKEGWEGPVFIQGDHFQTKAKSPGVPKEDEISILKKLIDEAILAGFYNIDIDTSTLVDLGKESVEFQQAPNIRYTAELLKYIRQKEPKGMSISIGGEIGHIGGKNSTVEEFKAYMDGLISAVPGAMQGISKVSVQTGTSHGGTVLPNGRIAVVDVDFSVLGRISTVARSWYGLGGAVQHGASTLSDEHFFHFPQTQAVEVHLATGFQNLVFDHGAFPKELLAEIYNWLDKEKVSEKKEEWNDEQFHYKLRKKGWGRFKKDIWNMDTDSKAAILDSVFSRFSFFFSALNVEGTSIAAKNYSETVENHKSIKDFNKESVSSIEIEGLSD